MNPQVDFDRDLREAMRVEPGGDYTARIGARVAAAPRHSPMLVPGLAFAAVACGLLAVMAGSMWQETASFAPQSVLPHRDLMVLSQPSRVWASPPAVTGPRRARAAADATPVVVSRSEMLALQRLFAGLTPAAPALEAPPEELSIPEIVIEPIPPLAGGGEGERQ